MGDYLSGDNLSPRKKCQEKLKPGNKPSTKSGQPFQLSDAGTLVAKNVDDFALGEGGMGDRCLSQSKKGEK